MTVNVLANLENFFQIAVILYVIVQTTLLVRKNKVIRVPVFFLLAMFSFLASDLYWVTHLIMMPETRIPFTANEVGDNGCLLLLGATPGTAFEEKRVNVKNEIIAAVVFAIANTALWIGWSGEWVKDIISGMAYGYLVYKALFALKASDGFSRKEWRLLVVLSSVLILCQAAIFFVPEPLKKLLDIFCHILLFAVLLGFFIRNIRAFRTGEDADILLGLSFAAYVWATTVMYMSADPIYYAADIAATLTMLLMFFAVRRKVDAS